MSASLALRPRPCKPTSLQQGFLQLLPIVERHAAVVFRSFPKSEREEMIAEARAAAYLSYIRLRQRRKNPHRFPSLLAVRAVQHVWNGRLVGGHVNSRDVLSWAARRKHGLAVRSLHQPGVEWREFLRDDHLTPVPEQVAFRLDWPAFVARQSPRDQRLMRLLARGDSAKSVAHKTRLSPGRVTQLRQRFCQEWLNFIGEGPDDVRSKDKTGSPGR
jgi:hypothetical protein